MNKKNRKWLRQVRNESGQGLTEYLTLLVLVAIVAIGTATTLGSRIKEKMKTAHERIHSDINFD